jgi:TonB-dependent receptor
MKKYNNSGALAIKQWAMGTAALVGLAVAMPAAAENGDAVETVVVTGYQHSLESAALAKRDDIGFSDTIFAEDIGKFPDSNIAEAMNRIPGVVLYRDPATGEGLQISVRGLGSQYTRVVLNNSPIAVATASGIDNTNSNRETDLNMFPGELFSNVSVSKSSRADQLEGGAAGTVNMRSRRPFDKTGPYLSYNLTGTGNSITNGLGGTAAIIGSDTWNTGTIFGDVGVLIGLLGNRVDQYTSGFDDGNGGWTTPSIKTSSSTGVGQCATATGCDNNNALTIGSNNITIPSVVPRNVVITSASGHNYSYSSTCPTTTLATVYNYCNINAYALADLNPTLGSDIATVTNKLANALFPRLLRNMYQRNNRWKYNGVMSLEVRPTDNLHFYADFVVGKFWENIDRTEQTQPTRSGGWTQGIIPADVVTDANGLVTSYTAYNAQWAIDTRHYANTADFFAINPGMTWQVTDLLYVELSANASRSHWMQTNAEMDVVSCPSMQTNPGCTPVDTNGNAVTGGVITYNKSNGRYFTWTSNIDVNNPRNYQWNLSSLGAGGGVGFSTNKRYTETHGVHLDLTYGGDFMRVKGGVAYDVIGRAMIQGDNPGWSKGVCQGYTNTTGSVCDGRPGSVIPQQDLYNYLVMGPAGFLTMDYQKIENASNFKSYNTPIEALRNRCVYQKATFDLGNPIQSSPGSAGCYEERILGAYLEAEGRVNFDLLWDDQQFRYNIGLRYVSTRQTIDSSRQRTDLAQTVAYWGNQYYDYDFVKQTRTYDTFLPSVNLVYKPLEDLLIRASASRTMTRASLPLMTSSISQSSFGTSAIATSDGYYFTMSPGNPNLKPYYSTNIDLGVEYYTGKEGYISVSAFRKFLHGVPITRAVAGTFADVATYGLTYSVLNSVQQNNLNLYGGATNTGCTDDATCAATPVRFSYSYNQPGVQVFTGLEFGYTQPFDFILEDYGLKGFGLSNNFTMIDFKQSSSNYIVGSDGSAPIHPQNVPHYSYNSTFYYQGDGFSSRLSYNYRSGYYTSNSGANSVCLPAVSAVAGSTTYLSAGCVAGAYIMAEPYSQFDFSSSVKLSKLLGVVIPSDPEMSAGITNIFRAKYSTYFQYKAAQDRYYLSNQTFSLSLRGTF